MWVNNFSDEINPLTYTKLTLRCMDEQWCPFWWGLLRPVPPFLEFLDTSFCAFCSLCFAFHEKSDALQCFNAVFTCCVCVSWDIREWPRSWSGTNGWLFQSMTVQLNYWVIQLSILLDHSTQYFLKLLGTWMETFEIIFWFRILIKSNGVILETLQNVYKDVNVKFPAEKNV